MSGLPGVGVFPTQKEILGRVSSWPETIRQIRRFDRSNLLDLAAQISLTLARKYLADAGDERLQNLLLSVSRSPSFSRRERAALAAQAASLEPEIFFNEQIVHFFTLAVLDHGTDDANPELNIQHHPHEAARLFLMLTDHLERASLPATNDFPHILAAFVRSMRFFGHGNHIANRIVLQKRIIEELQEVDTITTRAFGTNAKNYFLFCVVGLISSFVDPKATPRIDHDYFRNCSVPGEIAEKWVADLTQGYDEFKASTEAARRGDGYPNANDFGSLKRKPLIAVSAVSLMAISFPALMNKLTYGVWGACLASAKAMHGNMLPWTTAFGNAFEGVVNNLLEAADKSGGRVRYYNNPLANGAERADLIILDGDRLAIVEIKTLVLGEVDLAGEDELFVAKILKTLFGQHADGKRAGALRQLANGVTHLLDGRLDDFPLDKLAQVKKIFPVLITYEDSWEAINLFNEMITDNLTDIAALADSRVRKMQVMNARGMECLVAAVESGESPLDFVEQRLLFERGRAPTEQFAHHTGRRLSPASYKGEFSATFAWIKDNLFPS